MSTVDARTHYMPFHRNDKYPKHLYSNFRNMKPTMLKKYIDAYELQVRPDVNSNEMCIAVARHFDSHLEVDEDEVLARFMNAIRRVPAPQHGTEVSAVGKRTTTRRVVDEENNQPEDAAVEETTVTTTTAPSRKQQRSGGGNANTNANSRGGANMDDDHMPTSTTFQSGGGGNTTNRNNRGGNNNNNNNIDSRITGGMHPNMYGMHDNGQVIPPMLPTQVPTTHQQQASNRNTAGASSGTARGGNASNKRGGNNQNNDNNSNQNNTNKEPEIFCLCKQEAYGDMIACDNPKCPIEWFHLGCVGLSGANRPSNDSWFCPDCKRHQRTGLQPGGQPGGLLPPPGPNNPGLRGGPGNNQMMGQHPQHMMNMNNNGMHHPMSEDDYNHLRNQQMMPRGMPGMNMPRGPAPPGYMMGGHHPNVGGGNIMGGNTGIKRGVNGQPLPPHPMQGGGNVNAGNPNNMMRKPGTGNGPQSGSLPPMRGNALPPHPMNMMGPPGPMGGPRRMMPVGPPPPGMMMNPNMGGGYPPQGNLPPPPRMMPPNMGGNQQQQQQQPPPPFMNGPPRGGAGYKNVR